MKQFQYHNSLSKIAHLRRFITWTEVPNPNGKKPIKKPDNYETGIPCNPLDPSNQCDLTTAMSKGRGVGFVLTSEDDISVIDIDGALQPDGSWSKESTELLTRFPGAVTQLSNSGTGFHIFARGKIPPHSCKNVKLGWELYDQDRFIAMTGQCSDGDLSIDFTDSLTAVVEEFFKPTTTSDEPQEWTDAPVPEWNGYTEDWDLIDHAMSTKSLKTLIGASLSFEDVWTANSEVIGQHFPSHSDGAYDASSADLSLASRLAYHTGKDCTRMERLMRCSALVRPKWDKHRTYLRDTILKACAMTTDVIHLKRTEIEAPVKTGFIEDRVGFQYMTFDQQKTYFGDATYIADENRILCKNGEMLKESSFKAKFGGYEFQMDHEGKSTTDAWKVFTQSQCVHFPKADSTCFRPDLPFGTLVGSKVNTYLEPEIQLSDMSPEPFLAHLRKLVPDREDRLKLASYMASVVQHKGVKFQWCPLIQGCEGNGKTMITRVVAYAVGEKYTHMPTASDLDNKFNGWMINKIFIGVEDIYVPEARRDLMETLKPMITGERIEIQRKGMDQLTTDSCANFILNSNHKDAIMKSSNDRRYAVFYTAQQSADDLVRDGMVGNYFPDLYNWLKKGGYGAVAKWLNEFNIPDEYNPATSCTRVPKTSSTEEAVTLSLGSIEFDIMEAVEEQLIGFCGGWISSTHLKQKFERRRISTRKLGEIVESLGYTPHPTLKDGRANNPIMIDNTVRSKLYVKKDSLLCNIDSPSEVVNKYIADQQVSTISMGVVNSVGR